jgi:MYXO-CTERM domain-containing protein
VSWLDRILHGVVDADPVVLGVCVGVLVLLAAAATVVRRRRRPR